MGYLRILSPKEGFFRQRGRGQGVGQGRRDGRAFDASRGEGALGFLGRRRCRIRRSEVFHFIQIDFAAIEQRRTTQFLLQRSVAVVDGGAPSDRRRRPPPRQGCWILSQSRAKRPWNRTCSSIASPHHARILPCVFYRDIEPLRCILFVPALQLEAPLELLCKLWRWRRERERRKRLHWGSS